MISAAENPNLNCLEHRRCPRCGSYGPFEVSVSNWVLLCDEGTGDAKDKSIEFDENSAAKCPSCEYTGQFGDFDESRP
jgi:hypothetical protein